MTLTNIENFQWLPFLVAITILTMTPGVDSLLVIRNAARGGWRDGILTSIGICCGLFVHAAISAAGLSVVLLGLSFPRKFVFQEMGNNAPANRQ